MAVAFASALAASACPTEIVSSKFINNYSNQSGGAILLNSSSCDLSLSYSLFQNCTSDAYGGAIYFCGSAFVCRYVCFDKCIAYQYSAFYVNSDSYCANFTCVTRSNLTNAVFGCNIWFKVNYSNMNFANISKCCGLPYASIGHFSVAIDMKSTFCIFSNNSDLYGASFDMQGNSTSFFLANWNVINNSPGAAQGLLWFDNNVASFVFTSCCFSGNGNSSFAIRQESAGSYSCLPTFISCYFDIQSSAVSGMTVSNCQFGLSNVPTNTIYVLSFVRCSDIWHQNPTAEFTNGLIPIRKFLFISSSQTSMRIGPLLLSIVQILLCK